MRAYASGTMERRRFIYGYTKGISKEWSTPDPVDDRAGSWIASSLRSFHGGEHEPSPAGAGCVCVGFVWPSADIHVNTRRVGRAALRRMRPNQGYPVRTPAQYSFCSAWSRSHSRFAGGSEETQSALPFLMR